MKTIQANQLSKKLDNITVVDVRSKFEYFLGRKVPKSLNIPMVKLMNEPEKFLDKSKEYHIICQSGGRSQMVCTNLSAKGYKVVNVAGGMNAY